MSWQTMLMAVPLVYVGLVLLIQMVSWAPTLGVQADGKLAPCPSSPNCVSSQATDAEHVIEPFTYTGPADAALERLKRVVAAYPRTEIVKSEGGYLRAACTTLLMRYIDDLEFLQVPERQVFEVRSASRIGHSDLGANRARVEALRAAWKASEPQP